jgi:hypothetical protein
VYGESLPLFIAAPGNYPILITPPINTIKLREYMCISGTDALASTSVWVKLKASLPRAKILKLSLPHQTQPIQAA